MRKTIRLTESDLVRLVKKVIKEQTSSSTPKQGDYVEVARLPKEIQDFVKKYNLTGQFNYATQNGKLGIVYRYNKNNQHFFITVNEIKIYEDNKNKLKECNERDAHWEQEFKNNKQIPKNYNELEARQNQLKGNFENMGFCGVVQKVQKIIDAK